MISEAGYIRIALVTVMLFSFCFAAEEKSLSIEKEILGKTTDGKDVQIYTLTNKNGLITKITEMGAVIVSIEVPDRDGKLAKITTGPSSLSAYLRGTINGGVIGRFANRISNAKFTIDEVEYKITANMMGHHIHGGRIGFHSVLWKGSEFQNDNEVGVKLSYLSKDGEEGYPGNLNCSVTYSLTNNNELKLGYVATTDKPTVLNLTNHAYFNLLGEGDGRVMEHEIYINADKYTATDDSGIPSGEILPVKDTPLDFTEPNTIGAKLAEFQPSRRNFDFNYVINGWDGKKLILAARVYEPTSGRVMEVLTTQPGVQLYTSEGEAFCLETQHFPDSPNRPEFPSTILRPNETFKSQTIYKFSTK